MQDDMNRMTPPAYTAYAVPASAPAAYAPHLAPAAPDNQAMNPADKLQALRLVAEKYELAGGAVSKLRKLEGYDIVFIADDSSSMNNPAHEIPKNDPFANVPTRWQELEQRVLQVMEIACCLDRDGIDLYFLNRPPQFNVHDINFAKSLFVEPPRGYTPLSQAYRRVLKEKLAGQEEKILIIVATDGEPNKQDRRGTWTLDSAGFTELLKTRDGNKPGRCPTTIMACTDSDHEVGWLNALDDTVPCLDVVDDFKEERAEIMAKQGQSFHFTMGDYVVKTLLGSIDPIYDEMDEKKFTRAQLAEYTGRPVEPAPGCCAIL